MLVTLKLTFSSADCTVIHKSMTTGKSTLVGIFLAQTLTSAELDASFFSRLSIAARRTMPSCLAPIKVGTVSMMVERTAKAEWAVSGETFGRAMSASAAVRVGWIEGMIRGPRCRLTISYTFLQLEV